MTTHSSTSEYQPSPPITRLNRGRVAAGTTYRKGSTVNPGTKTNMCVAPATNGERAFGKVAPSQPAFTTKGMKTTPRL